jgi:hypothetical protein
MRLRSRRNDTRSRRAGLRVVVWVWIGIAYLYNRIYREQRTSVVGAGYCTKLHEMGHSLATTRLLNGAVFL